jgi:hypothetical protein
VVHPVGGSSGWSRTFEADGRLLALDGYWHTVHDHHHACAAAGLQVTAWEEPSLPQAPAFPAALVVRASRS